MSNGNESDDSRKQKRTRFATPEAPFDAMVKQTRASPITVAQDCVTSLAETLHDNLARIVFYCAANFMMRRQKLH